MNLFVFCLRVLPLLLILIGVDSSQALEVSKDTRQSSYYLMTPENRAMQDDSNLNPALFWVMDGQSLWKEKTGKKNIACASCHGDSGQKMAGVATQFPKMQKGKLQTLEGQINQCRTSRQEAPVLAYESKELLALTTWVASQSKGMPIAVQETPQNKKDLQQGRQSACS